MELCLEKVQSSSLLFKHPIHYNFVFCTEVYKCCFLLRFLYYPICATYPTHFIKQTSRSKILSEMVVVVQLAKKFTTFHEI